MTHMDNERFSRLLAMNSYPAELIATAQVVVGGVGALGNELVKNLCLLGFRKLFLIDRDRVERSNLTRSVLFSEQDIGLPKIQVAAAAARRIYEDTEVSGHFGDVAEAGFGVFRTADLIFSDFDGFYPRIFFNDAAIKVGKPWIDAALGMDPLRGSVMLYQAGSLDRACFACRMGPQILVSSLVEEEGLIGCQELDSRRIEAGFLPTSPITASLIAAIQMQAGMDLLRFGLTEKNPWTKTGFSIDLNQLTATKTILRKVERCPVHDPGRPISAGSFLEASSWESDKTSVRQAFADVRAFMELKPAQPLYIQYHTLYKGIAHCLDCGAEERIFKPVYVIEARKKRGNPLPCSRCGSVHLSADAALGELSAVSEAEFPFPDMTLGAVGFRRLDIIKFFSEHEDTEVTCHAEISGDRAVVFRPMEKASA